MTLFAWARVLWVSEWTMDMQKNEHGWSCKQSENCGSEGVQANGRFQLPSSLHVNFTRLFYTIFTYSALSRLSIFLPYRWEKVVLFLPDLFFLFSFLFSFFFFFLYTCFLSFVLSFFFLFSSHTFSYSFLPSFPFSFPLSFRIFYFSASSFLSEISI